MGGTKERKIDDLRSADPVKREKIDMSGQGGLDFGAAGVPKAVMEFFYFQVRLSKGRLSWEDGEQKRRRTWGVVGLVIPPLAAVLGKTILSKRGATMRRERRAGNQRAAMTPRSFTGPVDDPVYASDPRGGTYSTLQYGEHRGCPWPGQEGRFSGHDPNWGGSLSLLKNTRGSPTPRSLKWRPFRALDLLDRGEKILPQGCVVLSGSLPEEALASTPPGAVAGRGEHQKAKSVSCGLRRPRNQMSFCGKTQAGKASTNHKRVQILERPSGDAVWTGMGV